MPGLNTLAYYTLGSINAAESFIVKATAPFSIFSERIIYLPGPNTLAYYTLASFNAAESIKVKATAPFSIFSERIIYMQIFFFTFTAIILVTDL
jgi:hypothetical protein